MFSLDGEPEEDLLLSFDEDGGGEDGLSTLDGLLSGSDVLELSELLLGVDVGLVGLLVGSEVGLLSLESEEEPSLVGLELGV